MIAPRQIGDDPLHDGAVAALFALVAQVLDRHGLTTAAEQHYLSKLGRELRPGRIHRSPKVVRYRLQQTTIVAVGLDGRRPGSDRAGVERETVVGHDQGGVEFGLVAQPCTLRARSVGAVERKSPGFDLGHRRTMLGARVVLREQQLIAVNDDNAQHAIAQVERGLHRVAQARAVRVGGVLLLCGIGVHDQAVDHHLDGVHLVAVQDNLVIQLGDLAIDPRAHIASLDQVIQQTLVLPFAVFDDRGEQHDPRAFG